MQLLWYAVLCFRGLLPVYAEALLPKMAHRRTHHFEIASGKPAHLQGWAAAVAEEDPSQALPSNAAI